MCTRRRLIRRVALVLGLVGVVTAWPTGNARWINPLVGTAHAAPLLEPGETETAWQAFLRLIGRAAHGDSAVVLPALPRVFPRIPFGASAATRASINRERAAIFGEKFDDVAYSWWACGTAKILEKAEKVDGWVKQAAEQQAVDDGALPQQATGFVEQGAELSRSLFLKVYTAACEEKK
jgi:hypothetical protein